MSVEITDYTAKLATSNYSLGRAGLSVSCVVLHCTAGSAAAPDRNDLPLGALVTREYAARDWLTYKSGEASSHYLIGAELTGATIYRLCPEQHTAYHAAGRPTRNVFVAPDGTRLEGSLGGVGKLNRGSIGIERYGIPTEKVGPIQSQKMIALVVNIANRYRLKPEQIVSHAWLQTDRSDGNELLAECRAAVAALWEKPAPVADLPYQAKLTAEGFLHFGATGKTVKGAILDYFLRFAGALPAPSLADYSERVFCSVHVFGLPLTDEYTDGAKVLQRFEQAIICYDPAQPDGWKVRPLRI